MSPLSKREAAVKKLNEQFTKLYEQADKTGKKVDLLDGVSSDGKNFWGGAYDTLLKSINDKNKDKTTKTYREDAGTKMLDDLRQQYAASQAQNDALDSQTGKVTAIGTQAQALAKFQQQIADIQNKDVLTAEQKTLLSNQDLITAQLKRNAALEAEVATRKMSLEEGQKLQALQDTQTSKNSQAKDNLDSSLAGAGMGMYGNFKRYSCHPELRPAWKFGVGLES